VNNKYELSPDGRGNLRVATKPLRINSPPIMASILRLRASHDSPAIFPLVDELLTLINRPLWRLLFLNRMRDKWKIEYGDPHSRKSLCKFWRCHPRPSRKCLALNCHFGCGSSQVVTEPCRTILSPAFLDNFSGKGNGFRW